ncbi:MAG TPA: helix-turn-helix transcriptional regulator [Nocardioides sp.]|nr:helix-turn-helix transcriptional regulator [Nocardioides sp.]
MTDHPNTDDVTNDDVTTDDQAVEHPAAGQADGQVEVRRNVALAAGIGGFAALLTAAFAVRAFTGGTALDWLAFGVLALVTVAHVAALVDSRAPLLVADPQGVRLRQGATWQGIAWPEIDCLEHLPRRGLLKDGHLLVDGYDDRQLVVPLTLATRVVGASGGSLSDVLADLADGRADVVEVVPGLPEEPAPTASSVEVPMLGDLYADDDTAVVPSERRGIAARVAAGFMGVSGPGTRDAETDDHVDHSAEDELGEPDDQDTGEIAAVSDEDPTGEIAHVGDVDDVDDTVHTGRDDEPASPPPGPGRPTVLPARVEVERPLTVRLPDPGAEPEQVRQVDDSDTMTVVLDHLAVRPADEPVIGPQLGSARERLRLTVDQLSERTRIRPHVIEAIEADDFAPCGGDFYARGHLRTLARVLGVDAGPLVATYDEKYAHAPVDPRRVFESELATGAGGAIRSTRGGRNWSVLIAAVMAAILVWSVARLVMDGPVPIGDAPVLNQSGGVSSDPAAKGHKVKLALSAAGGGAQLVVRDGGGDIVFDGNLAFGQTSMLHLVPPVRIWSSDGSVTYAFGKSTAAPLGETGSEVSKTLVAR